MSFLKNHPFAVEAFFKSSTVFTFAIPKEELEGLIPECLTLDTFQDKWAFIAIAMVQTEGLRPKGLPKFLGSNFFLIGYRIFVRYVNNAGKRLRGLYILKSETDKLKMKLIGNLFTHYNYTSTDISQQQEGHLQEIKSIRSKFHVQIDHSPIEGEIQLPEQSPFSNWKEARRYAGPLPFTFTYQAAKKEVLIIEGVRQNWTPQPIKLLDYHFDFLDSLNLKKVVLANAFIINNIPYYWKKGKKEVWTA